MLFEQSGEPHSHRDRLEITLLRESLKQAAAVAKERQGDLLRQWLKNQDQNGPNGGLLALDRCLELNVKADTGAAARELEAVLAPAQRLVNDLHALNKERRQKENRQLCAQSWQQLQNLELDKQLEEPFEQMLSGVVQSRREELEGLVDSLWEAIQDKRMVATSQNLAAIRKLIDKFK